jgi:hypothetical protein
MHYAILAYHDERAINAMTPEEDRALMNDLLSFHDALYAAGTLGPAARLGPTDQACTLRGVDPGTAIDGPFAETKEALLGFYLVDCATRAEALAIAARFRAVNPTAVYEIRPVLRYLPGAFPPADKPM